MKNINWLELFGAIALTQMMGILGALVTSPMVDSWYQTLNQPFFQPPNWLFGPVWGVLYLLIAIAFYLLWQQRKNEKSNFVLRVFFLHIIVNGIWTPIFFGAHQLELSVAVILLILLSLIWIMIKSWKIEKVITWLLLPYLLWISFATVLNISIMILN